MRKPFNNLYDDFFSTSVPVPKKEEIKEEKKEEIIEVSYPTQKNQLHQYVLGQQKAIGDLELALKRPGLMEKKHTTILVCGPKGSGKHILLQRFHEFLYTNSFLSYKHPTYIDLSKIQDEMTLIQDLYSALQKNNHMIVFENVDLCEVTLLSSLMDLCNDGILPLKQRYSISKDRLTLATSQLEKQLVSKLEANRHYFVFLAHQSYRSLASKLGNHFIEIIQDIIETQPLDKESLFTLIKKDLAIFKSEIKEQYHIDLIIEENVYEGLITYYDQEGYHSIQKIIQDLHHDMVPYLIKKEDYYQISYHQQQFFLNDIALLEKEDLNGVLADIQKEMDDIVGLDEVKKYIYSLRDFIQLSKRRKAQGLKVDEISMHMIFTGNPGTGKTTMARLMAKYLKALGVLKNGQLLEVTRADLVASYVGQTAPKTKQVIEASLGGVLFIDEAYSLYRGKEDSFGLEAIDMLVKGMEDHRDDLVVVLAGYTKEMATFLEANSGLKSRFANVIEFPDYTGEQLLQIALSQAKKKDYVVTEEAQKKILDYFIFMQSLQDKRSGNGRLARNVIEDAILKQASRLATDLKSPLDELKPEDFILN